MLRPFFSFYGGKWRAAPKYPQPKHKIIIEPFAGSAGYSVRNYKNEVVLVEKDARIYAVWRYLIDASSNDIMGLPLLGVDDTVDSFPISDPEKWLIGFWLNKGCASPAKSPSSWMRSKIRPDSFWGHEIRSRIAKQVTQIKHWTVVRGEYSSAPEVSATWFIDPPYAVAGTHYRMSSAQIDFCQLGHWCKSRSGQVIVCENTGADWLPFRHFLDAKSMEGGNGKSVSREAIWTND